jgi:nucleoside-diphosphate-sugar epimerase
MDVVKARFFNSFGPGEVPGQYRNVIPNFIYWAMKKLPLPITGNIKATRDFTYVEDLIDGLIRMVQSEKSNGEEFNLAGGKEVEIGKLAHLINEITGNKAGIKIVDQRKWDTKSRVLASVDKAKDLLNYEPKVDFEVGLRKTINWFQENWEKIDENASFPAGMSSAVRQQKTK